MEVLVRKSLVERLPLGQTAWFSIFPFVARFAEDALSEEDRTVFSVRVYEHPAVVTEQLYPQAGRPAACYVFPAMYESNFWACLRQSSRGKRAEEEVSPAGRLTAHFLSLLELAHRPEDALRAAQLGRLRCSEVEDRSGGAAALLASGASRFRVADLDGARQDHEAKNEDRVSSLAVPDRSLTVAAQ
jgi:hypothetical protein